MRSQILLISGLHPNERCAPIVARSVCGFLLRHGANVQHYEVPYECTLLANLDDAEHSISRYCMPEGGGCLDADLCGLVGDRALLTRFPGHIAFEFHNSRDVWKKFGIHRNKPVSQFEIGTIAPVFTRPYEIGVWRNVLPDGTGGKHVVELPAVMVSVCKRRVHARLDRLAQLQAKGYFLEQKSIDAYVTRETDVEATRQRGFVGESIVEKVARWVLSAVPSGGRCNRVKSNQRIAPDQ